jgi:amidohydrolase
VDALKDAARLEVERRRDELVDLSHRIHAAPELGYMERKASRWVAESLEASGFDVERGVCELPTALSARSGEGELHIAICAEYDALPEIGHACGHNVIAAAAVGAGAALARVANEAGLTVHVLGTPAEEGGGGKVLMLERGAFDGMHAALMIHPTSFDLADPAMIAAESVTVRYTGKEAHAAFAPHEGINAADALTVAQVAVGLLRQHILPTDRIHGIVTKGGEFPNIVPASSEGHYIFRSRTIQELERLRPKLFACFEAGAIATGASVELESLPPYAHVESDPDLAGRYRRNAEALGRTFVENRDAFPASTDFGNVSLAMPAAHPLIGVESNGAGNHQPGFAAACATPSADRAVVDGAIAMAWTAIDAALDPDVRRRLLERAAGAPTHAA